MSTNIMIEVAYATPQSQKIIEIEVDKGTSVLEAARQSNIDQFFPEIDFDQSHLGVFGKIVPTDYQLVDGDRIEVYRALIADPKEIRRQRAEKGLKTKKGGGAD